MSTTIKDHNVQVTNLSPSKKEKGGKKKKDFVHTLTNPHLRVCGATCNTQVPTSRWSVIEKVAGVGRLDARVVRKAAKEQLSLAEVVRPSLNRILHSSAGVPNLKTASLSHCQVSGSRE